MLFSCDGLVCGFGLLVCFVIWFDGCCDLCCCFGLLLYVLAVGLVDVIRLTAVWGFVISLWGWLFVCSVVWVPCWVGWLWCLHVTVARFGLLVLLGCLLFVIWCLFVGCLICWNLG